MDRKKKKNMNTKTDKLIVGEDLICPVTKKHCDDECCPPGAECNLASFGATETSELIPLVRILDKDAKLDKLKSIVQVKFGINAEPCLEIIKHNEGKFKLSLGSSHNHQAWIGGYLDHILEMMDIAYIMYIQLDNRRTLPFSLSSALLIIFLHDIEKPWKYSYQTNQNLSTKKDREEFRDTLIQVYNITLSEEEKIALKYVEGEGQDYSNQERKMNELGAFVHALDVLSSRLWHDKKNSL